MTIRLRILLILPFLACSCAHHPAMELREIARFDTPGWAHDVVPAGNRVYVADRRGGFLTFDSLQRIRKPRISAPVRDVISLAPDSGMVVLASRFEGVVTVAPSGQVLGHYSIGNIANAVEMRGNLVFAAYGRHGLVILRLVNGCVQFVAGLPTGGWSHDLRISRDQAIIADWNGLKIVNIHNVEKPSQIAFLPSPATCISLDIKKWGNERLVALA